MLFPFFSTLGLFFQFYDSFSFADKEENLTYKLELTHIFSFGVHFMEEGRKWKSFCGKLEKSLKRWNYVRVGSLIPQNIFHESFTRLTATIYSCLEDIHGEFQIVPNFPMT